MNFFKVLLRPDREELENKERVLVANAANLLQVGEFQFLQLAYRDWFGDDLPEAMVDRLFADYMLRSRVPSWARHYARKILAMEAAGTLDCNDPCFHRYDHDYVSLVPEGLQKFVAASAVVIAVIGGGIWLADYYVRQEKARSVLPPYFDDRDLGVRPASVAPGRERQRHEVLPADMLPRFGSER
jgi:hypothetical protein